MQHLEVFNEVCTIFLIYVMTCFTDANQKYLEDPMYYDIAFLVGCGVNVIVHLYFLTKDSVLNVKARITSKCCKTKAKKAPALTTTDKHIESMQNRLVALKTRKKTVPTRKLQAHEVKEKLDQLEAIEEEDESIEQSSR